MDYPRFNSTNVIKYRHGAPAMRYILIDCVDSKQRQSKAHFCLPTNMCYIDHISTNGRRNTAFLIYRRTDDIIPGKKTFTVLQTSNLKLSAIVEQYERAIDYLANNEKYINHHHYSSDSPKVTTRLMHDAGLPHVGTVHMYTHQPEDDYPMRLAAFFRNKGASYNTYLGLPHDKRRIREKMTDFIRRTRHIKDIVDVGAMELLGITNPNNWWDNK